jgi:hypothetical protein
MMQKIDLLAKKSDGDIQESPRRDTTKSDLETAHADGPRQRDTEPSSELAAVGLSDDVLVQRAVLQCW